jgi:hypothetical protein
MMPWELEHILRAAGESTGCKSFIVIGSQAIIGSYPKGVDIEALPREFKMSNEVDLIPEDEALWELVEQDLGENSMFAERFGYHADGVERSTAILPTGWEDRLVPFETPGTNGVTGFCLEIHDRVVSKLVAGRGKDRDFCWRVIELGMVDEAVLFERLDRTSGVEPVVIEVAEHRVREYFVSLMQARELLDLDE